MRSVPEYPKYTVSGMQNSIHICLPELRVHMQLFYFRFLFLPVRHPGV